MNTPQEVREVAAYIRGRMMRFDTSYLCRPQLEKAQAMLEELARLKEVRDADVEKAARVYCQNAEDAVVRDEPAMRFAIVAYLGGSDE